MRRPRRATGPHATTRLAVVVLSVGIVVSMAGPAAAHPFIEGGSVPVDSLAEVTLAMAHGCGTEDQGGGDPTTDVSLEVPESMTIVDVPEIEGYDIELERDAQGRTEVVTWTATTSQEPAPQLTFDAVVGGEPGSELYLKVFQGCEGFAYRWIGTPDEPAESPAVRVDLTEADPDSPPPEESGDAAAGVGPDGGSGSDGDAGDGAAPDGDTPGDTDGADDPAADGSSPGGSVDEDTDAAPAVSGDGGNTWIGILLAVAALIAVLGIVLVRRRRPQPPGE